MPPTPNRRYRRITAQDNFLTTGRTDNPVGAFTPVQGLGKSPAFKAPTGSFLPSVQGLGAYKPPLSNPSTAVDGQFGAPFGTAPSGAIKSKFSQPVSAGQALQSQIQGEKFLPSVTNPPRASARTPGTQGFGSFKISQSVGSGQLPVNLTSGDIRAFGERGLDVGQLVAQGLYSYNAATGNYGLTPLGLEANKNTSAAAAGQPQQQDGASPFGRNSAGQRLDASGNVFDPATATRDIYGGRFIQVGETRWERNKKGKLVKVQYLGGGKKKQVTGGAGQARNRPKAAVQNDGYTVSNSFINFNTASG